MAVGKAVAVLVGEGSGTTTLLVTVGVAMKPGEVGAGQGVAPMAGVSPSTDAAVGLGEVALAGTAVSVGLGTKVVGATVGMDVTCGVTLGVDVALAVRGAVATAVAAAEVGDGVAHIRTASGTWRVTSCRTR